MVCVSSHQLVMIYFGRKGKEAQTHLQLFCETIGLRRGLTERNESQYSENLPKFTTPKKSRLTILRGKLVGFVGRMFFS